MIKKILFALVALSTVLFFGAQYASQFVQASSSRLTPSLQAQPPQCQSYHNNRYHYSLCYPSQWFVETTYAEDDFSARGPANDQDFIGGDVTWSNYQNPSNFTPENVPDDLQMVSLVIYKVESGKTLEDFVTEHHFDYSKKESFTVNDLQGLKLTASDSSTVVLFKSGDKVFDFGASGKNGTETMLEMLKTFSL